MDLYLVSLATGAVGLGIMGIGGLSHGSHAGHGHGGHDVHVGHTGHAGHAHAGHGHASHGFGAGGIAATPLGEPWQFGAALLASAAFEMLMVGPLWRFLFRFESRPAATLESTVEDEARAVTGFDANGCGLVAVDVDGQIVQLLATLAPDERSRGVRFRSGDRVRIAEVDAARGRCTVTQPTR